MTYIGDTIGYTGDHKWTEAEIMYVVAYWRYMKSIDAIVYLLRARP